MYKMMGADGREYGPISVEQLRQWIGEGRANAQTSVQAEGSTEWKTLGELPEFADAFSAPTAPPIPPTARADFKLDIGSCISRGWALVWSNHFWTIVGTSFLVFLLLGGIGGMIRAAVNIIMGVPLIPRGHFPILMVLPGIGVSLLWNLLVAGVFIGGLCQFYLKLIRGQPATLGDAFAGFSSYPSLTATYIVRTLLTMLGTALCVLPGIYLSVAWKFALPLVIDKGMPYWDAMELSRRVVTRQWWRVFGLILLTALIAGAGLLACCVGIFVTIPVGLAALLYAYEDLFGSTA